MEVHVFKEDGSSGSPWQLDLPDCNSPATLRNALVAYQNNFRQGDAQAKTRAEVSGSGKKPYRQKGTGMARHGEKRSPIWSGGGVTFGPRRRDYTVKINKKQRRLALSNGLSLRAKDGSLFLIENLRLDTPKTKNFLALLRKMEIDGGSVLMVDDAFEDNVILAARNIPTVFMVEARTLSALDAFQCDRIILSKRAMDVVLSRIAA
ncbi:MAG: 50S ribosomal protein L4 [Puniceicoccales bacterium]|jgi:large subunit ribosomal protein L4|nr:50S ribosomal protein L4 [Puniceicoccales bacterium]